MRFVIKRFSLGLLLLSAAGLSHAATYYVNPATGNMSNNGTSAATPWSTLAAVFSAGKTFAGGDTIYLYTGNHGSPTVTGNIAGAGVAIRAMSGQTPGLVNIVFSNASGWTIDGLSISPMHVNSTNWQNTTLVDILATSHHITVKNCDVYQVNNTTGWTAQAVYPNVTNRSEFNTRMGARGVRTAGTNCTIEGNYIRKTAFAVEVANTADYTIVRGNLIEDTVTDGIRGLADNCLIEDNTLRDWYGVHHDKDHHDDGIQGFSGGGSGGTLDNLIVRRNLIINTTTSTSPWPGTSGTYRLHGMLFYDAIYNNARIENNVVVVDNLGHGIALGRGVNAVIANNTVVWNSIRRADLPGESIPTTEPVGQTYPTTGPWKSPELAGQPWVTMLQYPQGASGDGSGNKIRNNISGRAPASGLALPTSGLTTSNGLLITGSYSTHFVDYNNNDLHLIATSSAVDAGTSTDAPSTDFDGNTRTAPYDIGAYEYGIPAAPSFLTTTASGFNTINLSWTDNSSNETGFKIQRAKGNSGVWVELYTTAANATSYSDSTAGAGTQYYYRVRSYNSGGESLNSNESQTTTSEVTGRVGHWKMDESSGTTTADASGNSYTGNLGASPANPAWDSGKIGNALRFDGADDVVNCGSGALLDNLSTFTISAWINAATLGEGSKGRILAKVAGLNPDAGWHLHVSGTNQLEFRVDYSTTDLARTSATNVLSLNTWKHVLVTWSGSLTATNARMYVDGVEVPSYAATTNGAGTRVDDSASNLYIGNENTGARTFDGKLDDVRVYNKVLSAAEITAVYRAGL